MIADRTLGMTIIGQTGMGKTSFLHNLIMEDIREGRSSIVIDPHGDLSTDLLESIDEAYAEQVYTLEVSEDMPFGLNLYECENRKSQLVIDRVVDNSILVFKRLMQSERDFHPHIEYLLRNTAYTILSNPTITMAEVGLMFAQSESGKTFRSHLLRQISNTNIREFWQGVERRTGNIAYQYIEPLLNKVSPFTTSEVMRMIVGQQHTTIPFSDFLDMPSRTLIVNLPIGVLGEEKTQMLGMTFLSLLSEHIYERVNQRRASRVPLHLYIDEAGLFFSSGTAISKLLKQGRKFGCATHLSFQTLSDLPDKEAQSAVLQVGSLVLFQVIGGTDAEVLSKQLQVKQPPVEQIPRMRMEPNMIEWSEDVWDDPEAQREYEAFDRNSKEFWDWEWDARQKLNDHRNSGLTWEEQKELEREFNRRHDYYSRMFQLLKNHRHRVYHERQDGWKPVKTYKEGTIPVASAGYKISNKTATYRYDEQQLYDMVDGNGRPYSDLWNELQANLATLPPYYYYMQTISEQQEIVESQQKSTAPPHAQTNGQEQAEAIRARSLLYFGTPAEQVRKELQDRITPFLGRSEDDSPDIGKSGGNPKPKPKSPPISGAKPYP